MDLTSEQIMLYGQILLFVGTLATALIGYLAQRSVRKADAASKLTGTALELVESLRTELADEQEARLNLEKTVSLTRLEYSSYRAQTNQRIEALEREKEELEVKIERSYDRLELIEIGFQILQMQFQKLDITPMVTYEDILQNGRSLEDLRTLLHRMINT